jgi:hypothetical protein
MRAGRWVDAVSLAVVLAGVPGTARAQRVDDVRAGIAARPVADSAPLAKTRPPGVAGFRDRGRPYAPALSAIAPGSGQFILGNDRGIAYVTVEVLGWWKYIKDTREQASAEASFRDLARRVSRAHFSTALPDGPWSYYEAMEDFDESGRYSLSDAGAVVPETDATTFNGLTWLTALRVNSTAAAALADYEAKAVKPEFRWSWINAGLTKDLYKRAIARRNSAYLAGVRDLTVIGINHLLSMVDAFSTLRLQARSQTNGQTRIGAVIEW